MHSTRNVVLLCILLLAAACVSVLAFALPRPESADEEDALRARLTAFWDARLVGDGYAIYELMEPKVAERFTPTEFAATQAHVQYFDYEILSLSIEADRAEVRVRYEWMLKEMPLTRAEPLRHEMNDRWRKVDGRWYREYREPRLPGRRFPTSAS